MEEQIRECRMNVYGTWPIECTNEIVYDELSSQCNNFPIIYNEHKSPSDSSQSYFSAPLLSINNDNEDNEECNLYIDIDCSV